MAFYKENEDKLGFKSINIPRNINVQTLSKAYEYDPNITEYLNSRLRTSLTSTGADINSNEYYAGDYYLKYINENEYFVLNSKNIVGISTIYNYGNSTEIKSALYDKKAKKLTIKSLINDWGESSSMNKIFINSKELDYSTFTKEDMEIFKENFFRECYECDGLDQIIDLDQLRDIIIEKTGRVLS